jgi:hypothetical protein
MRKDGGDFGRIEDRLIRLLARGVQRNGHTNSEGVIKDEDNDADKKLSSECCVYDYE